MDVVPGDKIQSINRTLVELKLIKSIYLFPVSKTINRTLVELKPHSIDGMVYPLSNYQSYLSGIKTQDEIKDIGGFVAINRTLVELKQKTDAFGYQERYAINRTLVELKPSTASPLLRIAYLSIVP